RCRTRHPVVIGEQGQRLAQARQPAARPFVEAADRDHRRAELFAEGEQSPRRPTPGSELDFVEILHARADARTVSAGEPRRGGSEKPVAAEPYPRIVLAVIEARLVVIPVEATLVLDPPSDDA